MKLVSSKLYLYLSHMKFIRKINSNIKIIGVDEKEFNVKIEYIEKNRNELNHWKGIASSM